MDIQNIINNKTAERPDFIIERDAYGNGISTHANSSYFNPKYLDNTSGTLLPKIVIVVQF